MSKPDKPKTSSVREQATSRTPKGLGHSDLLTPSEIESLRQDLKEAAAYMDKRLKSQTKPKTSGRSDLLTPSEIESLRQDGREASAHMRKRLKSQTKPK
jgi:hypothetical protein